MARATSRQQSHKCLSSTPPPPPGHLLLRVRQWRPRSPDQSPRSVDDHDHDDKNRARRPFAAGRGGNILSSSSSSSAAFIYTRDVVTSPAPASRVSIWNNTPVAAAERRRRRGWPRPLMRGSRPSELRDPARGSPAAAAPSPAISPASYLSTWTRTPAIASRRASALSSSCNV